MENLQTINQNKQENTEETVEEEKKIETTINKRTCAASKVKSCGGTFPISDFPRKSVLRFGEVELEKDRTTLCIRCIHQNKLDSFLRTPFEKRIGKLVKRAKQRSEEREAIAEELNIEEATKKWYDQGGTNDECPICVSCQERTCWMSMDPNSVRMMWERNEMQIPWQIYANVVSMDRIDSSDDRLPYHKNFQFLCRLCNSKKAPEDVEDRRYFYWKDKAEFLQHQVDFLLERLEEISKNDFPCDDNWVWIKRDSFQTDDINEINLKENQMNGEINSALSSMQAKNVLMEKEIDQLKKQLKNAQTQSETLSKMLKDKCPPEVFIINKKRRLHFDVIQKKKRKMD